MAFQKPIRKIFMNFNPIHLEFTFSLHAYIILNQNHRTIEFFFTAFTNIIFLIFDFLFSLVWKGTPFSFI